MQTTTRLSATVFVVLFAATAMAGGDPAVQCQSGKNKTAGSYFACREKAEAAAIKKGVAADYTKCSDKFDDKWDAAETSGAGSCPDNAAASAGMNAWLALQATDTARIVAGTQDIPTCGYGIDNGLHPLGDDCWGLSAVGANCDSFCAGLGLVYDAATATIGGSSDAYCEVLMDLVGVPGSGLDIPSYGGCPTGLGCNVVSGTRVRCTNPTDSASSFTNVSRVCACQ